MRGSKAPMGAGKIKANSGTPVSGNSAGSNVMLAKNTASSTPVQKGSSNYGMKSIYRVPSGLNSKRGR